jgi:hypothetical protein
MNRTSCFFGHRNGAHEGLYCILPIRHLSCYSYIESRPVKVLVLIDERKHLHKKYKIYCHLRYEYFITVNRIVITTLKFQKR